jgi:hypothetical protein
MQDAFLTRLKKHAYKFYSGREKKKNPAEEKFSSIFRGFPPPLPSQKNYKTCSNTSARFLADIWKNRVNLVFRPRFHTDCFQIFFSSHWRRTTAATMSFCLANNLQNKNWGIFFLSFSFFLTKKKKKKKNHPHESRQ